MNKYTVNFIFSFQQNSSVMGITNFCKLLQAIYKPYTKPTFFDSVLVDCQSFLYIAIEHSLEIEEEKFFDEISESVWEQIEHLLKLFSSCATLVLSFDGEGVPMKWATQRERRRRLSKDVISKKSFYRYVLFGNNKLTIYVQNFVLEKLKNYNRRMKIVLCGCNVPGEGEHKIFQIAEALKNCLHPIVVSVDQDVFILSLLRMDRYETIQIYRYNQFYSVGNLNMSYPVKHLIIVSFLFGNDFIPSLISITATNPPAIHCCLSEIDGDHPPTVLLSFVKKMDKRIRYSTVEFVDRNLMIWFWTTYFWILDYYTQRHFPQQFLENHLYEAFDRNQLLTGLTDEEFSEETFREAEENYKKCITQPLPNAERQVFIDSEDLLNQLKSYWIEPTNGLCTVLHKTL